MSDTDPDLRDAVLEVCGAVSMQHLEIALKRYEQTLQALEAKNRSERTKAAGGKVGIVTDADLQASIDLFRTPPKGPEP